jgi:translocation protein SEC63
MEVTLVVEEASKAAEMKAEDEISEPEEGKFESHSLSSKQYANKISDSLAGQMHVLKTGQTPKARRRDSDDSEEESGTDEEEEDTSATNTDTEDES